MRICTKCKVEKEESEFYKTNKRKDGIYPWCADCCRKDAKRCYKENPEPYRKRAYEFNKKQRKIRIEKCNQIKSETGCISCGEKTIAVLDFHHYKDKENGMPVTRAAHTSNKRMDEELAKCVVLCANCHRKVHAGIIKISDDGKIHQ